MRSLGKRGKHKNGEVERIMLIASCLVSSNDYLYTRATTLKKKTKSPPSRGGQGVGVGSWPVKKYILSAHNFYTKIPYYHL